MQATGIGPALRKARLLRGKSIEEASRETRIRTEYLQALERERFESLLGEVYTRGFLRSYSTYLGLDPDKVVSVYNRHFGEPHPTAPERAAGRPRRARHGRRSLPSVMRGHPSWLFAVVLALVAVGAFAAAGLIGPRAVPPPADPRLDRAVAPLDAEPVTVAIRALEPVTVAVTVDGTREQYRLNEDEARSFEGEARIEVEIERGGTASLTVNGYAMGTPGRPGLPYSAVFGPEDFRGTPSSGNG